MRFRLAVVVLAAAAGTLPAGAEGLPIGGVKLTRVGTFAQPTAIAARAGDARLFVAEKTGRVQTLDGATVLDLSAETSAGGEGGLLGLAFSPGGTHLYLDFIDAAGRISVTSFATPGGVVDLASRREIMSIDHPVYQNHYGGALAFGPDGYLYVSTGDGGGGGDPFGNAQNLGSLLGKLLRVDPDPTPPEPPYSIPASNPFIGVAGARPEIWSYGLRNPWRFSFDRLTGDIWIGDVGQNLWEEIDYRPRTSPGGENYGWNRMEGNHPYLGGTEPPNHVRPVYEYPHGIDCSVTGGFVYRGTAIPTLQSRYLFADFCAGRLRALITVAGLVPLAIDLGVAVSSPTAFGEDAAGELYIASFDGGVFRIDPVA